MRLAVINQEGDGGATAAAREALEWGPKRGFQVRYFPGAETSDEASLLRALGDFEPEIIHLHCWHQSYSYDLPLRLPETPQIVITLHDVAVVNQYGEECWECYRNPWCLGCPALGRIRRWRPNHRILERRRKRQLNRTFRARVVHPSEWMKRRLRRTEWARLEGEVIPYGIDLHTFKPGKRDRSRFGIPDGPVALFVGHMYSEGDHRKGLPDLMEAWAIVRSQVPDATLVLAGRHFLEDVPAGVQSLGNLDTRDLRDLYRAVDLFCLPSRGDNLPVAVIEAMACGLPVVATRVGGIPEEVEDGVTGILTPARDPSALARALVGLLKDASRRAVMSDASRARAVRLFSRDRSALLHEALYRRLVP